MGRPWPIFAAALIVAVVAALAFSGTLHGGFVLDDQAIVVRNPHLRRWSSLPRLGAMNWWKMAAVPAAGNLYRPLAAMSLGVDVCLFGEPAADGARRPDARAMHGVNIACHALASVAVLLLLLLVLPAARRLSAATAGACFFAAHPAHVEAVANIVGRAEILCGLFVFAAAAAWLAGTRGERDVTAWTATAAVLWFGAMLCKEMAVTLPVLLLVVDLCRRRRRDVGGWVAAAAPFVALAVVYGVLRHAALGDTVVRPYAAMPPAKVPYAARLMTMCHAFAVYLRLAVWPTRWCPDYSGFAIARGVDGMVLGCALLHSVVLASALWLLRVDRKGAGARLTGVGLLLFYAPLFPVSNILVNTGVIISERALYIPSFGMVLAFAFLWRLAAGAADAPAWRSWGAAAAVIVLVGLGIAACRRGSRAWRSEETLFAAAVTHPYCGYIGLSGMARVLLRKGEPAAALRYVDRALAMRSNVISVDYKIRCLLALGRHGEAVPLLRSLIRNGVGGAGKVDKLALCLLRIGRPGQAKELLERYPGLIARDQPLRRRYIQARQAWAAKRQHPSVVPAAAAGDGRSAADASGSHRR